MFVVVFLVIIDSIIDAFVVVTDWALPRPRNPIQISCRRPLPCHQCPCQIVSETFNANLLTIKTNLSFDNSGQFQTSLVTLFSAHYQYVRWDFKLLEQKVCSQIFSFIAAPSEVE